MEYIVKDYAQKILEIDKILNKREMKGELK